MSILASRRTFELVRRVLDLWDKNPELFSGFKISKEQVVDLFNKAEVAGNAVTNQRARRKADEQALRIQKNKDIDQARVKFSQAMAQMKQNLADVVEQEKVALSELSDKAKAARFYAKSKGLVDDDATNDEAAEDL